MLAGYYVLRTALTWRHTCVGFGVLVGGTVLVLRVRRVLHLPSDLNAAGDALCLVTAGRWSAGAPHRPALQPCARAARRFYLINVIVTGVAVLSPWLTWGDPPPPGSMPWSTAPTWRRAWAAPGY